MTLFSVPALLIMFREALEAAVVVSVLLQLVEKMRMRQLKKHVWIGALTGVAISIVIGIVFIILFYVAGQKIFTGNSQSIFKGVVSWLASLLITVVAFHMLKFYNVERKWRQKLEGALDSDRQAAARSYRWPILLLALSATLREGIESVLFLTGVSQGDGVKSIIIPGIVGVILGLGVGMLIFYTGRTIKSLKWFFIISCGLLLFIAAGLVSSGVVFFTSAGLFGTTFPYENAPWYNKILWDTSSCCNMYTNEFWSLVRALFGYTDQPTALDLLYYLLYWFIVLGLVLYKWWRGTLTDRQEAQIDDLKSFALHAGERLDTEAGLDGKSQDSADLEAGQGKPGSHAPGGMQKAESAGCVPALLPAAEQTEPARLAEGSSSRNSVDDSVDSLEKGRQADATERGGAAP